jgi:sugar (pentulose or hexulose) kinase
MPLLLGIDAGTTSVKAGLFDSSGTCLAVEREEYQLDTPSVERAQLDPHVYWQACVHSVREVMQSSHADPKDVIGLAVSSQGETTITLEDKGQPLYPALVWVDNRATPQAESIARELGDQVYLHTGIPEVLATWPACKIRWIRENEPEIFAKASKFLLVQDFLIYQLTGRYVTDGSIACTTLLFDITTGDWWPAGLAAAGVDRTKLPEIVPPGSIVGGLSLSAAQELGLPTTTMVVTGGMDQSVGAIGAGNIKPGLISESTGAALAIQVTITDPAIDRTGVVPVYWHSVPGLFLLVPVCPTAGMAFKWFRDAFFNEAIREATKEGQDGYDLLTTLAGTIPPGSDGLVMLPHLMGAFSPIPNLAARGAFVGFTLTHTRGHFVRALLEGVAYLLRQNLESIESTGININEICSTGGGARSSLWNQIKSDVCAKPILTLENEETALLGDAILAGVACGVFHSIEEGCQNLVKVEQTFDPGPDSIAYSSAYQRYCELDQQLAPFFRHSYPAAQ